ncbi:helix-turn-helix transcriptional regulator [Sporanaerobacter acetigenes]|uniref:WYL domain-containing protein n=1 Tax=Sporanaerobacter acetigenes DSM 13106 TaxID=1123281 RepID=A0A1M5YH56_9FIRM|nr:HTH domain-containing protein [Sporanaerobacter acetigenes]SHI11208.1 WYL domain-containing protein [Sporanaerobacter acetigenes DSM 13106]
MKTNRMLEIITILLNEGEVKAKDLAERFNCTTKTIYRDVEYIKESGIPIISEIGRNGGFKIGEGVARNNKTLTLKEQHTIINVLKSYGRIPEEQLDEIMTTIEGLFKDNTVNWIDGEFADPKINSFFQKLKNAIINCNIVELGFKMDDEELNIIKVEPYQIFIRYDELYLRFFNLREEAWDEVSLKEVVEINLLKEDFVKKNYPKLWNKL